MSSVNGGCPPGSRSTSRRQAVGPGRRDATPGAGAYLARLNRPSTSCRGATHQTSALPALKREQDRISGELEDTGSRIEVLRRLGRGPRRAGGQPQPARRRRQHLPARRRRDPPALRSGVLHQALPRRGQPGPRRAGPGHPGSCSTPTCTTAPRPGRRPPPTRHAKVRRNRLPDTVDLKHRASDRSFRLRSRASGDERVLYLSVSAAVHRYGALTASPPTRIEMQHSASQGQMRMGSI
jgi:hypothetical protein